MVEILKVKNLCKDKILKDISFSITEGEMVAIMGPSGSGKSTLLYQISGMDIATSGEVWLGDTELCGLSEDELAKIRLNRMGFVFQQMNMLSNLNVLDNIMLPAQQAERGKRTKSKREIEQYAKELMKKLSIAEIGEREITQVSGGQLQRACICRSMMNHPEILFADEPTGALNQKAAQEVIKELQKLNEEGTTILMVTHDSKIASRCERILYLLDGGIKGELLLKNIPLEQERAREEEVNRWLAKMGW